MCRLFGMTGGPTPVRATFWLLEAADSLRAQSHRDPDGTGLGSFDPDGRPRVDKQALPAYADEAFAVEARELTSRTFVAHIRYASTGAVAGRNTHPFLQAGRLFAHNGVVGDLPRLEAELGSARDLVGGDTDSERVFALITARISDRGGDVTAPVGDPGRDQGADPLGVGVAAHQVAGAAKLGLQPWQVTHHPVVREQPPGLEKRVRVAPRHGARPSLAAPAT